MAQRNPSARGGTATRATGSSGINRTDIAQMRMDEIRNRLRKRGVTGISGMRKDDLVNTLVRTMRAESRRSGRTGPTGRSGAAKPGGRGASAAQAAGTRRATAAKRTGGAGRSTTAKPAAARKATTRPARAGTSGTAKARGGGRASGAAPKARIGEGGIREGRSMSRSLRYAQRIASPSDRPDRPGRSLVTTNHEVIRRWARDRQAQPATIEGTERDGRAGVLTFNFPGWREGGRIKPITWDAWLRTFDLRQLNFIYQEQRSNGGPSNFFRTESPNREDA
ncbi:hypothetical protein [Plantactinospora sp. KBS50]|uniref:hypothetical protein n=1 Tax=Plantactinospora sp. KBS50 TaxID=2024580 RepID=UPI000BAAEE54|nr:hypothetical protein [Plantactinospora sp. KBS50]ASW56898.1 hypothetical protein CIK06_26190 [Plantactinospora sp. KBS50]